MSLPSVEERPAAPQQARPVAARRDPGAAASRRGQDLQSRGQLKAARDQFLAATRLAPESAVHWARLAQCQHALGQIDDSIRHLERAFRLDPASAGVCQLLADLLLERHRHAEVIQVLEALDPAAPRDARWHLALAKARIKLFDFEGTVKACSMALALAGPDRSIRRQALLGMAHGFMKHGSHAEAALCHRMLLDDEPRDLGAAVGAAHASSWACDWAGLAEDFDRLAQCIQRVEATEGQTLPGVVNGFPLITLTDDPEVLHWASRLTCRQQTGRMAAVPRRAEMKVPRPQGRVRIGLVSSDFHNHATAILVAECLEAIDRERFELWLYSGGPDDGSALRARIRAAATAWCETADLTSGDLARRIRDDRIGVLIEMKGYTLGARMDVMAHRPAPVQVSWLGYPGTTGAPFIDYFIGDPVVTPLEAQPDFTERIAQMPHCYQPNDSTRSRPEPPTRAQCGLPAEASFVFASFNMPYKIVPEVFEAWCRILQAVPGSVLWLLVEHEPARQRLRAEAQARGLDPQRLVFAPFIRAELHRARLPLADLCLDTYPCGGHTTASDALWAGVPVLALTGRSFASRVAGSLLGTLGLSELACDDIDRYIAEAIRLATEPGACAALRLRLEQARTASPLFDGRRFARDLERLLLRMVERQDAGLPPAPLAAELS